ncbi:MAG TPA: ribosome recycling factor [Oligoflexia bacterium]|nr:ribosome recycling factor [Oligoflexia bacterium]HMP47267.1 ribosome recycling factor [Oligoflexia bacterium]
MSAEEINTLLKTLEEKSDQTIQVYKRDLKKVRTGRASASLLDSIQVDYYGSKTALTHLAQVSAPEPRLIVVSVYDSGAIDSVEKAIRSSDLGLNPARDGNTIRVNVPSLTEESRKELVRHLHKHAEEVRVAVRAHRRDINDSVKKLEKQGGITQDEIKKALESVQKKTDSFISVIDDLLKEKEAELMTI